MARRLPGLASLRAFEAAARHLGFTRAADELGVTPAAVSAQIRALEGQLGVRLFRRTSRTVRLTAAGETLLTAAGEALDTLARAVDRISPAAGGRLALVVSTGPSFATKWLVPRLGGFYRRHPEAALRVDVTEGLVDLARGEADLAVRFGTGEYPGLSAERLFEEEVFPVCSPRLLEGERPLRRPEDLRRHALVHDNLPMGEGEGEGWPDWRAWLLAAGVEGVDATRGLRFRQTFLVVQAAAEGQGVALGNTSMVADDLAAGRLVRPFAGPPFRPRRLGYHLVRPSAAADRPLAEAFRAWMLAEAGRGAA